MPLHIAASKGHLSIVKFICDQIRGQDKPELYTSSTDNNKSIARHINVDAVTNNGRIALHWAARYGYVRNKKNLVCSIYFSLHAAGFFFHYYILICYTYSKKMYVFDGNKQI